MHNDSSYCHFAVLLRPIRAFSRANKIGTGEFDHLFKPWKCKWIIFEVAVGVEDLTLSLTFRQNTAHVHFDSPWECKWIISSWPWLSYQYCRKTTKQRAGHHHLDQAGHLFERELRTPTVNCVGNKIDREYMTFAWCCMVLSKESTCFWFSLTFQAKLDDVRLGGP